MDRTDKTHRTATQLPSTGEAAIKLLRDTALSTRQIEIPATLLNLQPVQHEVAAGINYGSVIFSGAPSEDRFYAATDLMLHNPMLGMTSLYLLSYDPDSQVRIKALDAGLHIPASIFTERRREAKTQDPSPIVRNQLEELPGDLVSMSSVSAPSAQQEDFMQTAVRALHARDTIERSHSSGLLANLDSIAANFLYTAFALDDRLPPAFRLDCLNRLPFAESSDEMVAVATRLINDPHRSFSERAREILIARLESCIAQGLSMPLVRNA